MRNVTADVTSADIVEAAGQRLLDQKAAKRNAAKAAKAAKAPAAEKPAKPAAKPVVAEAKPDPRAARAERIAAERSNVAALYAAFEANRASIPVKTLSAFKPSTTTAHPIARNPSVRQAAAIAVALAAAGAKLADGASAPRVFERPDGLRVCIENGVLRDAVSSGLVTVTGDSPEAERLTVAPKAAARIIGLIGSAAVKAGNLA